MRGWSKRPVHPAAAAALLAMLVLELAGCGGNGQNALDPASGPERRIATLWWGMRGETG
jgi:hypothetical protein